MARHTPEEQDLIARQARFFIIFGAVVLALLVALFLFWKPVMRPWIQERQGMANLAEARFTNQIRAEQASADREAAVLRAEAIAIVGQVAKDFPEYPLQEAIGGFALALERGQIAQTFYIATKNSIPVLPGMGDAPTAVRPATTAQGN